MRINYFILALILSLFPLSAPAPFAATPRQCYSYFTELVRSSNYPFAEWGVKPQEINLIIDEDDDAIIRAKMIMDMDSEGTGTIGWVIFNKYKGELYNTTIDPEKPIKLKFNNEYEKAQKYCLGGDIVYQVEQDGRLYLFDKIEGRLKKSKNFIVKGNYVHRLEKQESFSRIIYQTRSGSTVTGWVSSDVLREIDFKNTW